MRKEIAIAPMLDWTDKHFRYFMRQMSPYLTLYTEMISTEALIHGDTERFLDFNPKESPLILQLGGSEPQKMAYCAKLAEKASFQGVNINAGCPSERVGKGGWGASLMEKPDLIAENIRAMKEVCSLPISVKTRIALAEEEHPFNALCHFVETMQKAGASQVIIHARKALLKKGFSPADNRTKMALDYDLVYRVKEQFSEFPLLINGDISTLQEVEAHFNHMDGVMIGREAYKNPYSLGQIAHEIYGTPLLERKEILQQMASYIEKENPARVLYITRHMMGLYKGTEFAKVYKKVLMQNTLKDILYFLNQVPF